MLLLALLVFLAGVLSFLAPCTLPVLPAYFAFSAHRGRVSVLSRTLLFGLGVMLVFLTFGLLAGGLGGLLAFNKRLVTLLSGTLLVLLGILVLLGKGVPGLTVSKHPGRTLAGSFAFGLIFAISWSGCIGPVLGFVLVLAANTQTALGGGLLLIVYTLGLLLPLVLLSVFLDRVPKRFVRILKGRMVRIGGWQVHTTSLITGGMLILLGIIFLLRLDAYLATSPLITWVFDVEESLARALNVSLG